jgi:quercetin dioxygenase-like cupin family protein
MSNKSYVETQIQIVDNVFVKMFHFLNQGDSIVGHAHTFDHITLLARGKVLMEANGEAKEHVAPKLIVTPKGVVHKFTALSIGTTLCCVHAIRDGDGVDDIADPNLTEAEAELFIQQFPLIQPIESQ